MEVGPGLTRNFFWKIIPKKSSKPVLIFWSIIPCVFCLYSLLVVSYYDLSVLSMSVKGFQKQNVWMGVGGGRWGVGGGDGVSSIQVYFEFF